MPGAKPKAEPTERKPMDGAKPMTQPDGKPNPAPAGKEQGEEEAVTGALLEPQAVDAYFVQQGGMALSAEEGESALRTTTGEEDEASSTPSAGAVVLAAVLGGFAAEAAYEGNKRSSRKRRPLLPEREAV
jgi:hypothetical protein